MRSEDGRLMKPGELAELWNVPISWVYSQAEAGVLPSHKIGKYRRFRPHEVAEWLEKQRTQNGNGGGE